MTHKHSNLSLEEQRLADDDAIYDRYVDESDEEEEPYTCEAPGCSRIAIGAIHLGEEADRFYYCARHLAPRPTR